MMFGRGLNSNTMTHFQRERRAYEEGQESAQQQILELAKRVEALERGKVLNPLPHMGDALADAPTPTRPLQVGDRVRNAAGTDTGEVKEICLDGDATINWDSGYGGHTDYNPVSLQHYRSPSHPDYGHVVLLEPDFDTQAREAGYVKAEEVLRRLDDEGGMPYSSPMPLPELRGWLRAQAKGGAK